LSFELYASTIFATFSGHRVTICLGMITIKEIGIRETVRLGTITIRQIRRMGTMVSATVEYRSNVIVFVAYGTDRKRVFKGFKAFQEFVLTGAA